MPTVPDRWFLLAGANFFGWLILGILGTAVPRSGTAENVVFSIEIALGLPLSLLGGFVRHWGVTFALLLIFVNPFLWATMVEWGLRRFVDPPKDSDAA